MNDPEYSQGIYEAAKRVTDFFTIENLQEKGGMCFIVEAEILVRKLKHALEGKYHGH